MCAGPHGSPRGFIRNLRKPMPLGRKLKLLARNQWIRVKNLASCCDHPGEPGC